MALSLHHCKKHNTKPEGRTELLFLPLPEYDGDACCGEQNCDLLVINLSSDLHFLLHISLPTKAFGRKRDVAILNYPSLFQGENGSLGLHIGRRSWWLKYAKCLVVEISPQWSTEEICV